MIAIEETTTLGDIVTENLEATSVLEKYRLDYLFGSKKTLSEACSSQGLDRNDVLQDLHNLAVADVTPFSLKDSSITELCQNILETHHQYVKEYIPRLSQLIAKVVQVHGESNPTLREIQHCFASIAAEFMPHLMKEEQILFPFCMELDQSETQPEFHCGSVLGPISVMEADHREAEATLKKLRQLCQDYTPPEWACQTYRTMLTELERFEADFHLHAYKENQLLFPKAVAKEQELAERET